MVNTEAGSSGSWRDDGRVSRPVQVRRDGGREFQILGAATLKLRAPNDVRTNGAERSRVLGRLPAGCKGHLEAVILGHARLPVDILTSIR